MALKHAEKTTSAPRFLNPLHITCYYTLSCVRIVPRLMNSWDSWQITKTITRTWPLKNYCGSAPPVGMRTGIQDPSRCTTFPCNIGVGVRLAC